MKITIQKKYIKLPVNDMAYPKKVCLYQDGILVFDFDCRLDEASPQYYGYINVERFKGMTFAVCTEPAYRFVLEQTDEIPQTDYNEDSRPQVHFTARYGWLNDPNGPFYYNGLYHTFFQHNEASADWGNMTWGHAISKDLVHWEQTDSVIFPDARGAAFSGSAWIDYENASGLQTGEHPPILLFYTAAGHRSKLTEGLDYTQCLVYSTDGGDTFRHYSNNPIVEHMVFENRDPKVDYSEELQKYVMILYLGDHTYMLMVSEDLLHWQKLQEISEIQDMECPDFYPIYTEETGEKKWVMSTFNHWYLVGDFLNGKFVPCQQPKRLHYGAQCRASQTFAGIPGNRRICASWEPVYMPKASFRCQLGIPMELKLHQVQSQYELTAFPVQEFDQLREQGETVNEIVLQGDNELSKLLPGDACDVVIQFGKSLGGTNINLFGTQIGIDFNMGTVHFRESVIPMQDTENTTLRIVADRSSVEIYLNGGRAYACNEHLMDKSCNLLKITATDKVTIKKVNIFPLKSMWR